MPELTALRSALENVRKFDFAMLHNEFQNFLKLRNEINKRFPEVKSYMDVLDKYCKYIEEFQSDWALLENEFESLTGAVMEDKADTVREIINKLGIASVN